eukprot:scaffold28704_cov16-Tisochrysis_lutea.AAC.2
MRRKTPTEGRCCCSDEEGVRQGRCCCDEEGVCATMMRGKCNIHGLHKYGIGQPCSAMLSLNGRSIERGCNRKMGKEQGGCVRGLECLSQEVTDVSKGVKPRCRSKKMAASDDSPILTFNNRCDLFNCCFVTVRQQGKGDEQRG